MPTPTKGPRLGGSPAHQRHIMANLATALFQHGKITTTETRARRLRPVAERLITFAKRGDLHARRQVLATLSVHSDTGRSVVHTLFADIAPKFANREGGYTRITKIGPRKGDNAPLAVIELVPEDAESRPRRRRARRTQPAARPRRERQAATATPEADATAEEPERDDAADSAGQAGSATAAVDAGGEAADDDDADDAEDDDAEDDDAEDAEDSVADPDDEADSDDEAGSDDEDTE